jgi:hypothetical protein
MQRGLFIVGVAALAFCAGAVTSFWVVPRWIGPLVEATKGQGQGQGLSDWLGFFGAVSGSILTAVFAAVAIYVTIYATFRQINAALYSREEDRIETALPSAREAQRAFHGCVERLNHFAAQLRTNSFVSLDELRTDLAQETSQENIPHVTEAERKELVATFMTSLFAQAEKAYRARDSLVSAEKDKRYAEDSGLKEDWVKDKMAGLKRAQDAFEVEMPGFESAIKHAGPRLQELTNRVSRLEHRQAIFRREIERLLRP